MNNNSLMHEHVIYDLFKMKTMHLSHLLRPALEHY